MATGAVNPVPLGNKSHEKVRDKHIKQVNHTFYIHVVYLIFMHIYIYGYVKVYVHVYR